jgi:DNA-binding transcriptional MerR regulator/methylmalonyl-CoA mutase cobalamin-binding subunit
MNDRPKAPQLLSIGALARTTGVPADTLRTWERRYGFPNAERTQTGHRRYSQATLMRLQLVRAAIRLGHRASVALTANESELRALLAHREALQPASEVSVDRETVTRWTELIRRFDGLELDRQLGSALATIGAPRLLAERIGPLIHEIGERWSTADVGVRHEHFASERLSNFFARNWQPLSDAATGPIVVCATPSGERHCLGLHMAALTLSLNNLRVAYLGPDVPAQEIVAAVRQHAAHAVLLSAAAGTDSARVHGECNSMRHDLGAALPIIVGGRGFEDPPSAVTRLASLSALNAWASTFAYAYAV